MAELALQSALDQSQTLVDATSCHDLFLGRGLYAKEGMGAHCSRLVLTYVSLRISQQSLKEGTVIIPIWQVKTT